MSAIRGRATRAAGTPTALFQARIDPELRNAVNEAAAATGVSVAFYTEEFFRRALNEAGKLPVFDDLTRRPDEELPIPAA